MEEPERLANPAKSDVPFTLADDLLRGAEQIAAFLFGDLERPAVAIVINLSLIARTTRAALRDQAVQTGNK